jgi:hypothetical protein
VWSKIVELATGDSAWEVETSRAVATVRGTAFGATNDASGSTFIGSENTVSVAPIDPATRKALTEHAMPLSEDKSLTVTDNDAISAGQGAWHPNVKDVTPETAPAEWINENESADEKQATLLLGMNGLSSDERMKRLFEGYGVTINDSGNGEVTIKTNEGTWTANNKLPADFPRDVPIYPSATVQGAVTATRAEQGGHYAGLETRDTASVVASWYKAQIASAGWAIAMNMESGGSFIVGGSKDNRTLMVTVSSDESGKTVIGLAVSQQ